MTDERNSPTTAIDSRWSVNETVIRWPRTLVVFDEYGIDACCGGEASLDEAAADAAIPIEALLEKLDAVAKEG